MEQHVGLSFLAGASLACTPEAAQSPQASWIENNSTFKNINIPYAESAKVS